MNEELEFTQRLNAPENDIVLDFDDSDGDEVTINSYAGGELIELEIHSPTGCMTLTREQAIQFANKLLELTKE